MKIIDFLIHLAELMMEARTNHIKSGTVNMWE
jgi:hypothetical protein